jgi:hypothetical protein
MQMPLDEKPSDRNQASPKQPTKRVKLNRKEKGGGNENKKALAMTGYQSKAQSAQTKPPSLSPRHHPPTQPTTQPTNR